MVQRKSIAEKVSFEIENHTTCLQNDSASEKGQIHFFGLSVILKVSDLAPSQIEHPVRGGGGGGGMYLCLITLSFCWHWTLANSFFLQQKLHVGKTYYNYHG